jgi:hypothetical protein
MTRTPAPRRERASSVKEGSERARPCLDALDRDGRSPGTNRAGDVAGIDAHHDVAGSGRAAHLAHVLPQRVHAVHAGMRVGGAAAMVLSGSLPRGGSARGDAGSVPRRAGAQARDPQAVDRQGARSRCGSTGGRMGDAPCPALRQNRGNSAYLSAAYLGKCTWPREIISNQFNWLNW